MSNGILFNIPKIFTYKQGASKFSHPFSDERFDSVLDDVSPELRIVCHFLLNPVWLDPVKDEVEGTLLKQLLASLDLLLPKLRLEQKKIFSVIGDL